MALTKVVAAGISTGGNVEFSNIISGVVTSTTFSGGSLNVTGDISGNSLNVTGVITATSFVGDISQATGAAAGLGTALSQDQSNPLNKIYYTDTILSIGSTQTVNPPDSSNIAYTQYAEIAVEEGFDLIVEDGDDLVPDILGLSTGTAAPLAGAGGRVRADNFTNKAGTGAPTFPNGVNVTGVVTATSFSGDGSALTGIDATSLKDSGDTIRVQANTSGAVVTGVLTATSFSGNVTGGVTVATGATISGSTNTITASTNGSERVRIDSSGRVGVGLTDPSAIFHVDQPSTLASSLTWGATAGQILRNEDSEFAFGLLNASPFPLWIQGRTNQNVARDIVLNPLGGNIGIGTDNPGAKLHVSGGNIKVDSGYGIDFSATSDGSGTASSELLDDYEEGTCTLYLATSSKTSQISSSGGTGITYTKIGRKIHIYGYIVFNNIQSTLGSNQVHLWGFPYNFSSLGNSVDNGIWMWTNGTAPYNYWNGRFPGISQIINSDGGGAFSHGYNGYKDLLGTDFGNSGLHFNFDYTYQI